MGELIVKSTGGTNIKLELSDRLTFIGGESGSGKTYMIRTIKGVSRNSSSLKESNIDVSRFVIIEDENSLQLKAIKDGSVVLIDRYDCFSQAAKKSIWNKMKKVKATWIVMTRSADFPAWSGFSLRSFKTLECKHKRNGRDITLRTKYYK